MSCYRIEIGNKYCHLYFDKLKGKAIRCARVQYYLYELKVQMIEAIQYCD
jgi:hypothetical protein